MPSNLYDPLLHDRPADESARPSGSPSRTGARSSSVDDDRLARLAARSAARRQELGVAAPTRSSAGRPGLPPPPPGARPVGASPSPRPTGRTTRRHAAKGSRTVALVLSVGTTVALSGWFKVQQHDSQPVALDSVATAATAGAGSGATAATAAPATSAASSARVTASTGTAATAAATTAAPATTAAAATSTGLADGTYTGAADSNRWGTVQVEIVVSGGSISDVQILQYPDSEGKSVSINNRALPVLIQETLTAQSSKIDSVSGATYTSDSYLVSLQSAIDASMAAAG